MSCRATNRYRKQSPAAVSNDGLMNDYPADYHHRLGVWDAALRPRAFT